MSLVISASAALAIEEMLTALQVVGAAEQVASTFRTLAAKGATWEELGSAMRNMAVSSESDAQAEVNKLPS